MNVPFDLHGGNLYQAARQRGLDVGELLDFSANINPLGVPSGVMAKLTEALPLIMHYPDATAYELKQAISELYQVPAENITPGNGAVELLYVMCYLLRPKAVLVMAPAFSEYQRAAQAAGAQVEYLYLQQEQQFALDIKAVLEILPQKDMIFIGNPNNPTGTLNSKADLEKVLQAAERYNTWVVVDEAFMDFLPDDRDYTCRSFLPQYPHLIISHSLTKFYAMPGLRLGFSLTNVVLAKALAAAKDQWNVNVLAQIAGALALRDTAYQTKSRSCLTAYQTQMRKGLRNIPGVISYTPAANYILLNIHGTGFTASELAERLLQKNILIRNCNNYQGLSEDYIRIAVKQPKDNEKLLGSLKQVVGEFI